MSFLERFRSDTARRAAARSQPTTRWDVVTAAITERRPDDAATALLEWFAGAVTDDLEDDNGHRTDCRQLVDRATAFLESPQGRTHARTAEVFEALAEVVYEARDVMTADGTAGFTRVLRNRRGMALPARKASGTVPAGDAGLLARFGRYRFLGWEPAGEPGPIDDWFQRLRRWYEPLMAGPPAHDRAVEQLNALGTRHGGWVAVGAWKVLLDYSADLVSAGREALVACLRAYESFGITNLAIHLPPVELTVYLEVFGRRPPTDGFFWPPVGSTPDVPRKADYLDAAAAVAAARRSMRLGHVARVAPARPTEREASSLWDFGRLVLLGPLLLEEKMRYEPAILARVTRAARNRDHRLVLQNLVEFVDANTDPAWITVGGARFCEEYLEPALTGSEGHLRLLDTGLDFLERQGLLVSSIHPSCLSPAETDRLGQRSAN